MSATLQNWDAGKLAIGIIAGGLVGFGLSVAFYSIRQHYADIEAARLAEKLMHDYEWKRVDGKMTLVPFDQEAAP